MMASCLRCQRWSKGKVSGGDVSRLPTLTMSARPTVLGSRVSHPPFHSLESSLDVKLQARVFLYNKLGEVVC